MSERDIPEKRDAEIRDRKIEITNREYEHVGKFASSDDAKEIALKELERQLREL